MYNEEIQRSLQAEKALNKEAKMQDWNCNWRISIKIRIENKLMLRLKIEILSWPEYGPDVTKICKIYKATLRGKNWNGLASWKRNHL